LKPRTQRQLERRRAALFATNLTSAKGTHRDDELDGLHETFYENGQLFSRGNRKYGKKYGYQLISASASEGTLGRDHLFELLDLVEQSVYTYILETNGMTLGHDKNFAEQLSRYHKLHVRVSIKGTNADEFHKLTGAQPSAYHLPFKGLVHLMDAGVSCNACVSISFSSQAGIQAVKKRLYNLRPGLLKSLELEKIKLFPKVAKRLAGANLKRTHSVN